MFWWGGVGAEIIKNSIRSPTFTAQKMKFSIEDLFSKCDRIRSVLRIWSHLLKKSLMENFIFCAVFVFAAIMFKLLVIQFIIKLYAVFTNSNENDVIFAF